LGILGHAFAAHPVRLIPHKQISKIDRFAGAKDASTARPKALVFLRSHGTWILETLGKENYPSYG